MSSMRREPRDRVLGMWVSLVPLSALRISSAPRVGERSALRHLEQPDGANAHNIPGAIVSKPDPAAALGVENALLLANDASIQGAADPAQVTPDLETQLATAPKFYTDILITELKSRDYVVLAKQEHQALLDHRDEVLERTDVPF